MKGVSGGLINKAMPPRVVNRSRSLDACVNPSVAESCALESYVNTIILLAGLSLGNGFLIGTVDVPSDRRNKHAGVALSCQVEIKALESIKDTKKVLQKGIEVSRCLIFILRECIAVTETGANWMLNVQNSSCTSPRMLVDAKVWRRIQTTISRIVKWLRHGRIFHENPTIERGATLGGKLVKGISQAHAC